MSINNASDSISANTSAAKYPALADLYARGVRLLIFDLDGTLLDSMHIWNQVDIDFLARYGIEVTPDYTDMVKRVSIDEAAQYTVFRYQLPVTPAEVANAWNDAVRDFYSNAVTLKPGALDYLTAAKKLGFYLAVSTALTRENAYAALRHNKIFDLFDAIITLEDLGAKADKSTPDIFLRTLLYVNATHPNLRLQPTDALVYDDVRVACRGARAGRFQTCAVYDLIGSGSESQWSAFSAECDYAVKGFEG